MFTNEHMKNFCLNHPGLVSVKKQAPGVNVLKYKNKVFFKNLWTPELMECRGTVVDDDFNIIQRPFTKIFNYGERGTKIDRDASVIAVEKINGFMAAATWHNGNIFISTTGSIASDFADMAREHLEQYEDLFRKMASMTFIFEICDERDPHIIPQKEGAYLLGARSKTWGDYNHGLSEETLDLIGEAYNIMRPNWKYTIFQKVKDEVKRVNHEGFVVWTDDRSIELKIKSPYYLVTKFLGRKSNEKLSEILNNPEQAKKTIDEEYYPVVDYLSQNVDEFLALSEQERFAYLRDFIEKVILA